ncbi:MAG: DUF2914 domain-containing protein [Candidatus Taylorbacteria bacterium]|nr:DUF2914 domain-containing protein [Candidatus Taylorbacteria bacterium]
MSLIEKLPTASVAKVQKGKDFFVRNERLVSFVAFVAGFIFDGLTLIYVSLHEAAVILGLYLIVIALGIIVFNAVGVRNIQNPYIVRFSRLIPYIIQFMFGTLLNASFIFYTASAQLSISWPFILFLAAIVLVNEVFHKRHQVLTFQLAIFFVSTFLYLAFAVPLYSGKIGDEIFLLSGSLSISALVVLGAVLSSAAKERFYEKRRTRIVVIGAIYLLINIAYFYNLIPPIPLALKDVGVYHSVLRVGDHYNAKYEESRATFWRREALTVHVVPGESVYIFSAIFAPADLKVPIYHEWFHYNETAKRWDSENKLPFSIIGGRDGGYRIYSLKSNISQGKWKVDITTGSSQHLGSIAFRVERVAEKPLLAEREL